MIVVCMNWFTVPIVDLERIERIHTMAKKVYWSCHCLYDVFDPNVYMIRFMFQNTCRSLILNPSSDFNAIYLEICPEHSQFQNGTKRDRT